MMRRAGGLITTVVLAVAVMAAAGCAQQTAQRSQAGPIAIAVTEKGFEPEAVTVPAGKPVTLLVTRQTTKTCATTSSRGAISRATTAIRGHRSSRRSKVSLRSSTLSSTKLPALEQHLLIQQCREYGPDDRRNPVPDVEVPDARDERGAERELDVGMHGDTVAEPEHAVGRGVVAAANPAGHGKGNIDDAPDPLHPFNIETAPFGAGADVIKDQLVRAFDKAYTWQFAAACGVRLPAHHIPQTLADGRAAAERMGFPVIVKSRFSHYWTGDEFISSAGTQYARNRVELDAALQACRQGPFWPVIQAYVSGRGKGLFALYDRGTPIAWFAHERLRDVRPSGSGSSLRRAIALEDRLLAPAARLLNVLRWHGPAMVEFRDDERGAPCLIELNGRFWGSLELAIAAGVNFPTLWLQVLQGAPRSTAARGAASPSRPPGRTRQRAEAQDAPERVDRQRPSIPAVPRSDRVLMGPGPGNPYPEVIEAMTRPVLGHLDPEFLARHTV